LIFFRKSPEDVRYSEWQAGVLRLRGVLYAQVAKRGLASPVH
jgi:hypothetical protein